MSRLSYIVVMLLLGLVASVQGAPPVMLQQGCDVSIACEPAPSNCVVDCNQPSCPAPCGVCDNPAAPHPIWGVDSTVGCGVCGDTGEVGWDSRGPIDWQRYAQGEYVGHARSPHVPEYRLRVDDTLAIFFLRTREVQSRPYELEVGDQLQVESLTAGSSAGLNDSSAPNGLGDRLNREVSIQPDGMITLPLVGRVPAARRRVEVLQQDLEERYKKYYNVPAITVTPVQVNTRLVDLLDTVDSRGGTLGGRQLNAIVTPAGRIQLPGLGSVYIQGLTIAEAKQEIDARYAMTIPGVSVTVDLQQRAPRFVYVLGQVNQPGRFELQGPTTTMQAIALAGGWQIGSNLRQVVVFRRGDDWRLMATMLDLRGALYGRRPAPADEIWLNDADIVLIPKSPIQATDELIEQIFTRGLYAAIPLELIWGQGFSTVSAIVSGF
jgi:polysaccharide export outer membrane protein